MAKTSSAPVGPRHSVTSLAEFAEWLAAVCDQLTDKDNECPPLWFRGVGDERHGLIPGLYRREGGTELIADYELRDQFKRRALALPKEMLPRNDWEWYFLMQHYRVPTRLLDWTEAALIALYFALESAEASFIRRDVPKDPAPAIAEGRRPAVWALVP